MRDFVEFLGILVAIIIPVLGGSCLLANFISKTNCTQQLAAQQLTGTYGIWTDCMVTLPDGKQVPLKYYNIQEAISRGIK